MMLTLAWLTISLPFVYDAQQTIEKKADVELPGNSAEEEADNPFANTTEEKTPGGATTLSEEYLHDTHHAEQYFATVSKEYNIENFSTYIAFYGELISPPPEVC